MVEQAEYILAMDSIAAIQITSENAADLAVGELAGVSYRATFEDGTDRKAPDGTNPFDVRITGFHLSPFAPVGAWLINVNGKFHPISDTLFRALFEPQCPEIPESSDASSGP